MNRVAYWLVLGFLVLSTAAKAATLKINHEDRRYCIDEGGGKACKWEELDSAQTLRVSTGIVEIQVQSTNTAAFTATFTDEPVEVKDITALKTFLGALKPYLVEMPGTLILDDKMATLKVGQDDKDAFIQKLETISGHLKNIRKATEETQSVSLMLTHGWDRLVRATPSDVDKERRLACTAAGLDAASFCDGTPLSALEPVRELFDLVGNLEKDLAEVRPEVDKRRKASHQNAKDKQDLDSMLAQVDAAQSIIDAGLKLLQDAPAILKGAQATEVLATELARVKSTTTPKKIPVKWDEGRKLTLKIVKRDTSANTYPTNLEPGEWVFSTMPDNAVRFQAGLSLMFAPGATFDKIEEGARTGTADKRFLWALTLGVIPRFLDGRDDSGFAGGIDLHLNPGESERALGVGAFASWRVVKVSAGVIGIKHQYLRPVALVSADTYTAKPYISLSVVGWPPFESK